MLRRAIVLVFLLVGSAVAGCISPSNTDGAIQTAAVAGEPAGSNALTQDWWIRGQPSGDGHDHRKAAGHENLSTPNFHVLGWDPLVWGSTGTTGTGMGCGGTGQTKTGQRIALVHSISGPDAFIVSDVTDPAAPKYLGDYYMPNAVVWDATITPDGLHAIVGAYPIGPIFGRNPTLPIGPGAESATGFAKIQPMFRDACTGETRAAGPENYVPYGPGLVMVGLQDPKNPKLEQWVPQPIIGPHSVSTAQIDNVTYVMSSVTNLVHSGSYYHFFQVMDSPVGSVLKSLAVIEAPGMVAPTQLNGHIDVELQKHPITHQLLAYLANWDTGLEIYDVSNWAMPTQIGHWADGKNGSIHEAHPLSVLWEGRHYTVAGQEVGEPVDLPSSWVYILDTTDPAHPKEVSRWTLPVKVKWDGGLQFSAHYLEVYNRTMFVANYHGGLWAVDLTNVTNPQATGIFVPYKVTPKPAKGCPCGPSIEDVVAWPDGVLTVWDNSNGVYQLRFDDQLATVRAPAWVASPSK